LLEGLPALVAKALRVWLWLIAIVPPFDTVGLLVVGVVPSSV
jgi:hypothetical protein